MASDADKRRSEAIVDTEEEISHCIRLALYDILAWMPHTDIVLTNTFGSWKNTYEDEEVALELKCYAQWAIARKLGKPVKETAYKLTDAEMKDPDTSIKFSLASIFGQVGRKPLSIWTYNWAEKKISDKAYWEKLEDWIQKNLPHVETENTELLQWYISRGKRRQERLQKLLRSN